MLLVRFAILLLSSLLCVDAKNVEDFSFTNTCDCGYMDTVLPGGPVWTDMWHLDFRRKSDVDRNRDIFFATYNIKAKYENTFDRTFARENVAISKENGALQIAVTFKENQLRNGGFGTRRQDFLYGSFRSYIKTPAVNGTVAAMYTYNPQQEIDIEMLGVVTPPQAYFAVHPGLLENGRASSLTHDNHWLGFDPTQEFHEYRFDWFPGLIVFYIDGVEANRMVTNVPNTPARLMFNHWSDGNPNFSRGPPTEDAVMELMNITAFFNYSVLDPVTRENKTVPPQCKKRQQPCSIQSALQLLREGPPSPSETSKPATMDAPESVDSSPNPITVTSDAHDLWDAFPYQPMSLAIFLFLVGCLVLLY